MPLTLSVSSTG